MPSSIATTNRHQPRATDVDRLVGLKIRQRRIMLGFSQGQLAELIGVTYQQAHKYETGTNRISAGRLHQIALALGVGIAALFPDESHVPTAELAPPQRMALELMRNFMAITDPRQQQVVCSLVRTLTNSPPPEADEAA